MVTRLVLLVLEVVFVLALLLGVGLWSVPAALVLAGVLGVVAVERTLAGLPGKGPGREPVRAVRAAGVPGESGRSPD
ncbi:hypothetical protein ACQEV4_01290 [Streptomyces shenzhenensis]|uniref:hypothetical protein n=1 Tax=Streptomyces shenzhenensis TaxID=943815 RepID=UPI003D90A3FB